jgi:hypothetical protein
MLWQGKGVEAGIWSCHKWSGCIKQQGSNLQRCLLTRSRPMWVVAVIH